jgi:hypothetical protein
LWLEEFEGELNCCSCCWCSCCCHDRLTDYGSFVTRENGFNVKLEMWPKVFTCVLSRKERQSWVEMDGFMFANLAPRSDRPGESATGDDSCSTRLSSLVSTSVLV